MKTTLRPLDRLTGEPCPVCRSDEWIVDADDRGSFRLLCTGVDDKFCVEERAIPLEFEVVDNVDRRCA